MAHLNPIAETSQSGFVEPTESNITLPEPDARRTGNPTIEAAQTSITDHPAKIQMILENVYDIFDVKLSETPGDMISNKLFQKPFAELTPEMQKTILSIIQKQIVPDLSDDEFQENTFKMLMTYTADIVKNDPDTAHFLSLPQEEQQERLAYYKSVQEDLETRYSSVLGNK